jgi:tetratricopeptide (TPR) repeat protein
MASPFTYMFRSWRSLLGILGIVFFLELGRSLGAADPDQARELFQTGQYGQCLEATHVALEAEEDSIEWPLLQVKSLMALGEYGQAATEARSLVRDHHPLSMPLLMLAHAALLHDNQAGPADNMLQMVYRIASVRRLESMNSLDLVAVGQALLLLGGEPRVVLDEFYSRALDNDPNCQEAYLAAGSLALTKQDYDLAAKEYQKALERFGDDPEAHYGLAQAFYHGDRMAMIQAIDAALHRNPRHVSSLTLLAEHQIDAEDYTGATELLDRAVEVNPWQPEAWALRTVLAHLKNDPNAVKHCRAQALKFWPNNARVDHLIGRKLSQKYRFTEGAASQRRALKLNPEHLPAKGQLAEDLLRLGDEDRAWALADEVYEADQYNVAAFNLVNLRDVMSKFKTLQVDGFTIRMEETEAAVYGDRVVDLLRRAKQVLCAKYGLTLDKPVTLELFPNQQDFAVRTFGMPGVEGFLGVCFGDVITANSPKASRVSNWEATLWHEFCHVVTLNMTQNKMPRWLSEGISVYEELQCNPCWGQHMTPQYRKMILGDDLVPISKLSSIFLSPPTPQHLQFAYYESALVVEFLVDRFGLDALKAILKDLGRGGEINLTIAQHTAPMKEIEQDFSAFARKRAQTLAEAADWNEPDAEQVDPSDAASLTQWLAEHPNSFRALGWQAQRLLAEEKWEQAKQPLQRLIELYPEQTAKDNAYSLLAQVHRKLGETKEEMQVLSQLAAISADAMMAYGRLMNIGMDQQDWQQVVANGERYLAVNPLLGTVHWHLGQAHEALGQSDQAVASYQRLLRLDPADPVEVNFRLARLFQDQDPGMAKRHLLEALADAPRFRAAHELLLKMREQTNVPTLRPTEQEALQ